jgi:hypothetical protein
MKHLKFLSLILVPVLGLSGFTLLNGNSASTTSNSDPITWQNDLPDVAGKPVGLLWKIAADLQATMTPEQKTRLFERMATFERQHKNQRQGRGMMGGRGQRGMMDGRGQRGQGGMMGGVAGILTPEQMQALKDKYKDQMSGAEIRAQAKQAMVEALGLSPRQQQDLEALRNGSREQLKGLRDQAQNANADKAALKEKAKQILENTKNGSDRIYTEKQKEIIKIHRALVAKAKMNAHQRQGQRGGRMQGMGQRGGMMQGMGQRGGRMQGMGQRGGRGGRF